MRSKCFARPDKKIDMLNILSKLRNFTVTIFFLQNKSIRAIWFHEIISCEMRANFCFIHIAQTVIHAQIYSQRADIFHFSGDICELVFNSFIPALKITFDIFLHKFAQKI